MCSRIIIKNVIYKKSINIIQDLYIVIIRNFEEMVKQVVLEQYNIAYKDSDGKIVFKYCIYKKLFMGKIYVAVHPLQNSIE